MKKTLLFTSIIIGLTATTANAREWEREEAARRRVLEDRLALDEARLHDIEKERHRHRGHGPRPMMGAPRPMMAPGATMNPDGSWNTGVPVGGGMPMMPMGARMPIGVDAFGRPYYGINPMTGAFIY